MNRITWSNADGGWGLEGVNLASLPPKAYGAICKLKHIEDLQEQINDPQSPDYVMQLAVQALLKGE